MKMKDSPPPPWYDIFCWRGCQKSLCLKWLHFYEKIKLFSLITYSLILLVENESNKNYTK